MFCEVAAELSHGAGSSVDVGEVTRTVGGGRGVLFSLYGKTLSWTIYKSTGLIQDSEQPVNNCFWSFQAQNVSASLGHLHSSYPHLFPSLITLPLLCSLKGREVEGFPLSDKFSFHSSKLLNLLTGPSNGGNG